jgi:hypothetical protein
LRYNVIEYNKVNPKKSWYLGKNKF